MSGSFWDEKTEETFCYSSFPWIQGRVLRGAIKYLTALEENPTLDKQSLLDAGVPLPERAISDSVAVQEFRPVLLEAFALLTSWVREPTELEEVWSKIYGGRGVGGPSSLLESKYPMSELLNTPFFIEKVGDEESVCPPSLLKLGLSGLFSFMEVSEDRLEISHEVAKLLVGVLDRLESYTDWEGLEDSESADEHEEEEEIGTKKEKPKRTAGQQMRAVFAACAANPESSVVA